MLMRRNGFRLLRGTLRGWTRASARGAVSRAGFCLTCGVLSVHDGGDDDAENGLRAGTLDDAGRLAPVAHIWTRRAQPWAGFPTDVLVYEREPAARSAVPDAERK